MPARSRARSRTMYTLLRLIIPKSWRAWSVYRWLACRYADFCSERVSRTHWSEENRWSKYAHKHERRAIRSWKFGKFDVPGIAKIETHTYHGTEFSRLRDINLAGKLCGGFWFRTILKIWRKSPRSSWSKILGPFFAELLYFSTITGIWRYYFPEITGTEIPSMTLHSSDRRRQIWPKDITIV